MKNVLITGGSRGIGAACVRAFAKNNYRVFFLYKCSTNDAMALEKETGTRGFKCDITSAGEVDSVYSEINKECKIDIIVNNAGISQIKIFQDITEQDWDAMFNVNIMGAFIVTKRFVNDMINKKSGRIINISSMWGEEGGSCEVHYSASKAAVIGFTKALAKELGPSGITVNCVSPGVIDTEMNSHLSSDDMECLKEETPVMRIGKAEEIADAVLYLASDSSGFITGAVLPVNGGMIM